MVNAGVVASAIAGVEGGMGWRLRLWYVVVHGSDSIELSRVTVWSRFGLSLSGVDFCRIS